MLTIEQLKAPRWELILNYPGNMFPVGTVFSDDDGLPRNARLPNELIRLHPKIFRPMGWWEQRQLVDFPKYLYVLANDFDRSMTGRCGKLETDKDLNETYLDDLNEVFLNFQDGTSMYMELDGLAPAPEEWYHEDAIKYPPHNAKQSSQ